MTAVLTNQIVDVGVAVIAVLVNLLMIGIFLSRALTGGRGAVEHTIGWVLEFLALPVLLAIAVNISRGREWWSWVLPGILVAFLLVELALDYVLHVDFLRTALLGPYLALYYLALMGMIGYAFLVGKPYGFVTLATHFLGLFATWFSYGRVGHGQGQKPPSHGALSRG